MAPALKTTGIGGAIFLVVIFAAFFCLSCIVLIIMEGVSAMVSPPFHPVPIRMEMVSGCDCGWLLTYFTLQLHSLRLAWVESFSKFAEFAGWPFAPFSFKTMLEESEELKEYMG